MLRVALVEDSIDIRVRLQRQLGALRGVEVVGGAETVAEALALIETTRPDVVVLDVELRGRDRGIDVLRHVARERPDTAVVVLSNFTWGAMREGFLAAGAAAYFDKAGEFGAARDWIAALAQRGVRGEALDLAQ